MNSVINLIKRVNLMAKKLIDQMEDFIVAGDLDGVCSVYNKLTGKSISPPPKVIEAPAVVDNPLDWGKTKLFNYIKKEYNIPGPSKAYSLEELQEIFRFNNTENELDEPFTELKLEPTKAKSKTSDFTYIPPKRAGNLLKMDQKPIKQKLTDFKTYNDEDKDPVERLREASSKVSATCRQCGTRENVHPSLIIGGSYGPDKKFICSKCAP